MGILAGTLALTASIQAPGSLSLSADVIEAAPRLGAQVVHISGQSMDPRLFGTYRRGFCLASCRFSHDGMCDDGGHGSEYSLCDIGSDCDDCGDRALFNDHAVYTKHFPGCAEWHMAVMWYSSNGWWKVGYTIDGTIPDETARIAAYDQAVVPEGVTSQWYVEDAEGKWEAARELHVGTGPISPEEALQGSSVVHLSGSLPAGAAHEWLGTYDRRGGDLVNEHAVYIHRGDASKAMWRAPGVWALTNSSSIGDCDGFPRWGYVLQYWSNAGVAMVPEKISVEASRYVNVSGKLLYAPALRLDAGEAGAAALRGAPSVYLSGELPVNADHSYLGTYDRRGDDLVNDHAVYVMRSDPDKAMWYSRFGRWMVGPASSLGSTAGIFDAYDPADTPEAVSTTWRALIKDEWIGAANLKIGVAVELKWRKILKSHVCGKEKQTFSYTVGGANVSTMEFEQHSQQGDRSWNLHAHGMLDGLAQLTPLLPLVAGAARAGGLASSFAEKTESEASFGFKVKDWALEQKAHQVVSRTVLWAKTETSEIEGDAWFQDGVLTVMCRFEKQLQASMNTGMATWNMGLPFTQQCFYTMSEGKQSKCSCSSAAAGIAGTC